MISVTWTARLRKEIKEELQKKGVSAGEAIEEYYKILRSKSLKEKLKELADAKLNVAQLEHDVTQIRSKSNTNKAKCVTIFSHFSKNRYRNIDNLTKQDVFWIQSQLDQKNIHDMSVDDFVEQYKQWANNGGEL